MSKTREQLEGWLKSLKLKADRVYDVGGAQLPVKERLGSLQCNSYMIFDLEIPHQTKQKVDVSFDINKDQGICAIKADIVFCLEVMEYVYDPVTALKNLAEIINKSGVLYISFPFIYPHHNPVREDMLRYTEFGARKLLENAGFEIIDIFHRKADKEGMTFFFADEGMKPSRDYFNHDTVAFNIKARRK